ncbi:MAG: type IV pilin protein [Pseudomonadales bacterium]
MKKSPVRSSGFTLVELMIAVVIIAILAAFAVPSYQSFVLESKRAEGTTALMRIMDMQERYYTNQFPPTYTTDLDAELGFSSDPVITESGYYSISAAACGSGITACVQLTATAQTEVAEDGNLTLDSLGNRTRDGSAGWD